MDDFAMYGEMKDDTLSTEFRTIFNYARCNPEEYKESIETRERMKAIVAEMKRRGFNLSRY